MQDFLGRKWSPAAQAKATGAIKDEPPVGPAPGKAKRGLHDVLDPLSGKIIRGENPHKENIKPFKLAL